MGIHHRRRIQRQCPARSARRLSDRYVRSTPCRVPRRAVLVVVARLAVDLTWATSWLRPPPCLFFFGLPSHRLDRGGHSPRSPVTPRGPSSSRWLRACGPGVVAGSGIGFDTSARCGTLPVPPRAHEWNPPFFGAHDALGVDGIGLTLLLLTAESFRRGPSRPRARRRPRAWGANAFFAWNARSPLEGSPRRVRRHRVFPFYVRFGPLSSAHHTSLICGFGGPRRSIRAEACLLFSLFGGLAHAGVRSSGCTSSPTAGHDLPALQLSEIPTTGTHITARWLFVGFFHRLCDQGADGPSTLAWPDAAERAARARSVLLVSILDKIGTLREDPVLPCSCSRRASRGATPVVLARRHHVLTARLAAIGQEHPALIASNTSCPPLRLHVLGHLPGAQAPASPARCLKDCFTNHGSRLAPRVPSSPGFLIRRRVAADPRQRGREVAPCSAACSCLAVAVGASLPASRPVQSGVSSAARAFHAGAGGGRAAVRARHRARLHSTSWLCTNCTDRHAPPRSWGGTPEVRLSRRHVAASLGYRGLGFFPRR